MRLPCKGCPTLACCSRGWDSRMCAIPLLTLSSSGNTRGQETQSSWAQNKRNSQTIQRREPKPGLINIHLIPPSRKSRESGAPESWWFHNETELKRLSHPSTHILGVARKNQNEIKSERKGAPPVRLMFSGDLRGGIKMKSSQNERLRHPSSLGVETSASESIQTIFN